MKTLPLLVLTACGAGLRVPPARFANVAAVTAVDDRRDVAVKPEERIWFEKLYFYDGVFQRRITRAMELRPDQRALGVNALDEVPDSTWFTNRIGVRDFSRTELARGPATIDSPELHKPWKIKSTKVGGSEIGFVVVDARGEKWLLKFDPEGFPEQETATHVIVGRLLWAIGYHITEDHIVYFKEDELLLPADAKVKDELGHERPLDRAELARRLAAIEHDPDGQIRGMASRWLPGKPLGGHPGEGVRDGDPNDRIPHELRRDLRGMYAAFAWLAHDDIQESNFLDMWTPDPRDPKRHFIEHYAIDFGKALGVMESTSGDPRRSYEYVVDIAGIAQSLVTAGALPRSWEGRELPKLRGIGLYSSDHFDPGAWKPDFPAYTPLLSADRFDKFWATKIMMRLSRDDIRTIVEAGKLTDPRAADYLVDTLVTRQRATAKYWFTRVNPLDGFAIAGDELCFDDLMLAYGLGPSASETEYTIAAFDAGGQPIGPPRIVRASENGHACGRATIAVGHENYTILRVGTARPGFTGTTFVHVARDPATGALRVIGIWRT
jgi:hypothetical protein